MIRKLLSSLPFLIVFLSVSFSLRAQDLKSDLKRSIGTMMPIDRISEYDVTIKYFDRDNLNNSTDSMKIFYSFYNECYKIRINDIETVQDSNYYVSVSTDEKVMLVGESQKNENRSFDYSKLDSLFDMLNIKIKKLKSDDDVSSYRILFEENNIDSMEIAMNLKQDHIEKIILFFSKDYKATEENFPAPVVQIEYKNYKTREAGSAALSTYATNKYFTIKNSKVFPSPLFASYEVINNINYNK